MSDMQPLLEILKDKASSDLLDENSRLRRDLERERAENTKLRSQYQELLPVVAERDILQQQVQIAHETAAQNLAGQQRVNEQINLLRENMAEQERRFRAFEERTDKRFRRSEEKLAQTEEDNRETRRQIEILRGEVDEVSRVQETQIRRLGKRVDKMARKIVRTKIKIRRLKERVVEYEARSASSRGEA
ncbi:hypothetical protein ACHAWO_012514 [Cyclotella atomus]|uniref:Uncharacterized protein n=1 Tax=Cyclotella atomus TaxID=382360 RepID=A0ABD3Q1B3_9STRA